MAATTRSKAASELLSSARSTAQEIIEERFGFDPSEREGDPGDGVTFTAIWWRRRPDPATPAIEIALSGELAADLLGATDGERRAAARRLRSVLEDDLRDYTPVVPEGQSRTPHPVILTNNDLRRRSEARRPPCHGENLRTEYVHFCPDWSLPPGHRP